MPGLAAATASTCYLYGANHDVRYQKIPTVGEFGRGAVNYEQDMVTAGGMRRLALVVMVAIIMWSMLIWTGLRLL